MNAHSVRPNNRGVQRGMLFNQEERGDDEEEKGEGKDAGQEDVQDVKPAVQMKRPYTPTQQEIDEHMPLHLPYRAWCPHCVAGKGIS